MTYRIIGNGPNGSSLVVDGNIFHSHGDILNFNPDAKEIDNALDRAQVTEGGVIKIPAPRDDDHEELKKTEKELNIISGIKQIAAKKKN